MRKLKFKISIILITFLPLLSKSNATEVKNFTDSCSSITDSIKRDICPLIDNPLQKSSFNLQNKAGFFDFVEDVWNTITSPLKPVWGYYEENGQRTTGPYTVFQQHQGFQIDRLRTKIQNTNDPYFKFYTHIYENALTGNSQNPDSL